MKKNLITINQFIQQSIGEWKSIRSSHSLAFQEFENTTSKILISNLNLDDKNVVRLLEKSDYNFKPSIAILINWQASSDWEEETEFDTQKTILVFLPKNKYSGILLRNKGYAETIYSSSEYFLDDKENLNLKTFYNSTIAEERICFLSKHIRYRYSVIRKKDNYAVVQTSHTSEIRKISNLKG